MSTIIPDPDFSIAEKEVMWDNDSLYIANLKVRAKNRYGGYEFTDYEYILVRYDGQIYEHVINLYKKPSVLSTTLNFFRTRNTEQIDGEWESVLFMNAFMEASVRGHLLEE